MVLTNLPLRSTIHKLELSERMACWAIELKEDDILYKPRLAKKRQVLADFLAEVPQPETSSTSLNWWTLSVDGASRQTGAGISLQLNSLGGDKIEQAINWASGPQIMNHNMKSSWSGLSYQLHYLPKSL